MPPPFTSTTLSSALLSERPEPAHRSGGRSGLLRRGRRKLAARQPDSGSRLQATIMARQPRETRALPWNPFQPRGLMGMIKPAPSRQWRWCELNMRHPFSPCLWPPRRHRRGGCGLLVFLDSQVLEQHVTDGEMLKRDDLLFTLDDREIRATIARDEAAISKDRAALTQVEAALMTTIAALLGLLPIAIGTGAGAELRQPL